ncbi:MAG: outer membrane beta-barrel domain-containing protein [Pseudomonadota bacterium]
MDIRFQFILLKTKAVIFLTTLLLASVSYAQEASDVDYSHEADSLDINNEVFELGIFAGIINIENFTSEFVPGISATFRASEDYFIQYTYLQADVSLTAIESSSWDEVSQTYTLTYDLGKDRKFTHYDLLVGYNVFQGEFFPSPSKANLSTLYVIGGVGNTEFGKESSMTYTVGIGYQIALNRRLGLHIDFRDYIYRSGLVTEKSKIVNVTQVSTGLKFSF